MNLSTTNCQSSPSNINYTPFQLKLPLVFDEIIKTDDPVYTFDKVMKGINLEKYIISSKHLGAGRIGYNPISLLKVILFAFTLRGYASTREIEKLCINDIRFRWILQNEKSFPTHMTISNFMNKFLKVNIEDIFKDVNQFIFNKDNVDTNHCYIDGTKMEANANKYTWVWKKACITARNRLYIKISSLLNCINKEQPYFDSIYSIKETYEINDLENIFNDFCEKNKINTKNFVYGIGNRKTNIQRHYELLFEYLNKLKEYANKISLCGDDRNSYSKTDIDATFMRIKKDYMGNDQLLPAYNLQYGICDCYIACIDINQYASDQSCFIPLMKKFKNIYNKYPLYPIADAGYGSYNNYLFCEENHMEKYMKFAFYNKETEDINYHLNPFRAINFKRDNDGDLICPNKKKFVKIGDRLIKGNNFDRTEEIYQCSDCSNCPFKDKCTKAKGNRTISLNNELTSFHNEVIENYNTIHGALLKMNRSIQSEGTFGILKQDRLYKRIVRKGLDNVTLEMYMIAIGYNIYKYCNKSNKTII